MASGTYAQVQSSKLNPWFVTGFCDAEACFTVSIYPDKRSQKRINWVVKPSFQISLNSRDIDLLLQIQTFLGCGSILIKKTRDEISLRVNSSTELKNFIIPHFLNYPLLSQKSADFYLFHPTQIVELIVTKDHLTEKGLLEIINIRASMNLGLSELQKSQFINYLPVPRQVVNYTDIPNLNWISGFSSGEGCFLVSISDSNKNKVGKVTQCFSKASGDSEELLKSHSTIETESY